MGFIEEKQTMNQKSFKMFLIIIIIAFGIGVVSRLGAKIMDQIWPDEPVVVHYEIKHV